MDASLVKDFTNINNDIKNLNKELDGLKVIQLELRERIIADMENSGLLSVKTEFGTVSITKETVANVTDWPTFENFIYETHSLHLIQRRVSNVAYRELIAMDNEIPGVEPYVNTKLGLRKS